MEARTKAETQHIEAQARARNQRLEAEATAESHRIATQAPAGAQQIKTEAETRALKELERSAKAYSSPPALLRLRELETLRDLARNANARIYIGFDKHADIKDRGDDSGES